ncbi:iron-siderophore ABC transporter substrate-binding protein [Microbacterium sp. zg-Y818]|uniref:iron-siderophore ABC transporter substrate-binding protein n=1 Tax=unclassified Microbacterium TaxID=2609290 RepID=UPI00214C66C0|nr:MULTISPECIES: iron-siderophore ABC transporter substrate-binding protein [unclassified Microbacterium]MCR2800723.1 iron-siderophore ABC transporter substrate-binding protein [Microbacterium sp. zg.Y818]WIM23447.1 iron-siderophore ABC transporter substrate-binding protein [Microbacterium sp. zg-Y818]
MPRTRLAVAALAASALLLSGCADTGAAPAEGAAPSRSDGAFPVTISHALGETTITEKPERVATVAWANHEVPLALGVVPVGMSKATWGDDDGDGVLPWVEERLEELDAETPVLFDETDGIDFEAVADTQPDVILAAYSGLTQEEYETLSKIAPVVAYPDVEWATSYEDMIRLNSAALGMADEGEQLVTDLEAQTQEALAAHPQLADAKVLFSYLDPSDFSSIGFYTSHDTRPGFLEGLGLPTPDVVAEESEGTEAFYLTVSSEQADRFADVDVFVTYGSADGAIIEQLQSDPLLSQIPAVAEGRIAILEDGTPLAASANPSPLSIGWGIDEYFAVLAAPLQ